MRTRIIATMLVLAVTLWFAAINSAAAETIDWQMQTIPPAKYWSSADAAIHAKVIKEKTGGQLNITVYPGGALGIKGPDTLDSISNNLMQMSEVWGSHVAGQEQIMELFELPMFVPWDFEFRVKLWDALYDPFAKYLSSRYNVYLLTVLQNEPRMLHTKKQVIRLADLRGMKIRAIGPVESEFTKQIGAVPVPVNWVELYTALQQGVVDGNWAADLAQFATKFTDNTHYTLSTNNGGLGIFVVVNKDALNELPPDVKKAFLSTRQEHIDRLRASSRKGVKIGSMLVVKKGGHIKTALSEQDRARMYEVSGPIITKWVARLDPESRHIYELAKSMIDDYHASN